MGDFLLSIWLTLLLLDRQFLLLLVIISVNNRCKYLNVILLHVDVLTVRPGNILLYLLIAVLLYGIGIVA